MGSEDDADSADADGDASGAVMWRLAKKNLALVGFVAALPGGIALLSACALIGGLASVPIVLLRRLRARNAVTVVRVPNTPVLKVMRGGKA